jgi:hypothetical protein
LWVLVNMMFSCASLICCLSYVELLTFVFEEKKYSHDWGTALFNNRDVVFVSKKITRKFNRGLRCVTEYAERCLPPGASGFLIPLNDSYSRRCSHLKTGIGKRLSSTKFSTGHFFLWIRAMVSVWSVVILCAGEVDPALLTPVAGIQTHSKPWQLLRILTIAGLNEA